MSPNAAPRTYKTSLTGDKFTSPPDPDEIEISIFGPGYGECVVLHLGNNNWFVIDSCIDPVTKDSCALAYFNSLNVNPSALVKQVIATHWHDDHIRGFGDILSECSSAEFVCSSALNSTEFLTLVNAYNKRPSTEYAGIDEMGQVIGALLKRKKIGGVFAPKFASENTLLWHSNVEGLNCSIQALSPSSAAILAAKLNIGTLLPIADEPKRALLATSPNNAAVVIWVTINGHNILLGSDLEEVRGIHSGWAGILNSTLRPKGRAFYFKIPHHGSVTAHNPGVWSNLLEEDPIATLTPYINGSHKLPEASDVNRICSLTNQAFTTLMPERVTTTKKRSSTVDKMIKDIVKSIKQPYTTLGHVRVRFRPGHQPRIELFAAASQLN